MGLSSSTQNKRHIFILSGQSNMAGRGGVKNNHWDHIVPDDCKPDPTTIHHLTANLTWETAQDPLHADIDKNKTCGVGPGMSFANAVKDYIAGVIGLVPCAIGGTAIKKWAKGEKLYEDMVKRARSAVSNGGEIKALLWYQGESDTSSKTAALSYKSNMENLIRNVRADLGLPALPVIQVAIASGEGTYIEVVREAQKAIDLPNVVCRCEGVGTEGRSPPLNDDGSSSTWTHVSRCISSSFRMSNSSGCLCLPRGRIICCL